ncbi:hypothetical protein MP228_009441 [Amoeboaphelidium protococcarum]|nr:hypothetical protein MP228_009441 [Amoeboaphelidium protococcarum]
MISEQMPLPVRVQQIDHLSILESDVSSLNGMEIQDLDAEYHGSVEDLLSERKQVLENNIVSGRFAIQSRYHIAADGQQCDLMYSPFASKLTHDNFHPGVYRSVQKMNSAGADNIDCLADYLGVQNVWRPKYETAINDTLVIQALQSLQRSNQRESIVALKLFRLVSTIATGMSIQVEVDDQNKVVVGGFMSQPNYDYASRCDMSISDEESGKLLFCTEIKSSASYAEGRPWYEKSRLAQVLAALYAFNVPLILLTASHFKVFCENSTRDRVLTFPFDTDAHNVNAASSLTHPVGRELIKTIVICLCQSLVAPIEKSTSQRTVVDILKTPLRAAVRLIDSISKSKERKSDGESSRVSKHAQSQNQVQPRFQTGCNPDGSPSYQTIRVLSPELVNNLDILDDSDESLPEHDDQSSVLAFESSLSLQSLTDLKE